MFPVSIQDKLSKTPLIITKRRQAAVATVDGNARELGMTTAVRKPFHDYLRDSSDDEQGAGASADTDYTLSPPANKILAATHLFMCLAAGAIDDATATAGTEWAGGSALTNGHEFFFLMDGVEYNIHRIADDTEVQSHADVLTHGWEILKGPTVDWHSSNFDYVFYRYTLPTPMFLFPGDKVVWRVNDALSALVYKDHRVSLRGWVEDFK